MYVGNTKLVDYGIHNEESDIRIHVGVYSRSIYLFKTADGRESIKDHHGEVSVYTNGIKTAIGKLVPIGEIKKCQIIPIPPTLFIESEIAQYPENGRQSEKGKAAVFIIVKMLKRGLIPITLRITEVNEKKMQIKGEDINVQANIKIQVKCDYRAGSGHSRCTGNLFLQIAECNPFGIY